MRLRREQVRTMDEIASDDGGFDLTPASKLRNALTVRTIRSVSAIEWTFAGIARRNFIQNRLSPAGHHSGTIVSASSAVTSTIDVASGSRSGRFRTISSSSSGRSNAFKSSIVSSGNSVFHTQDSLIKRSVGIGDSTVVTVSSRCAVSRLRSRRGTPRPMRSIRRSLLLSLPIPRCHGQIDPSATRNPCSVGEAADPH